MTHNSATSITRDNRRNWRAETIEDLADIGKEVNVITHKVSSGQLITTAQVMENNGVYTSFVMYQDFRKQLAISQPARITANVVTAQHYTALEQLPNLLVEVRTFYAAKVAEPA